MTPRYREFDGVDSKSPQPSVGIRLSSTEMSTYELTVIASDVADAVHSAGGWICDRARAGWRVTVLIPSESAIRPLAVLGVRALPFETEYKAVRLSSPAAIAAASRFVERNAQVRRDIQRALLRGTTEVTLWGKASPISPDWRISNVRYQLSGAARAFKTHALIATSPRHLTAGPTEDFRSAAMWYPPNGADLAPIGR
jgi:hypothetical protein